MVLKNRKSFFSEFLLFLERRGVFLGFAFMLGYLLIAIIIPYWLYNSLINWDTMGLYFSSWYQKYFLFPNVIGWNPYFFLGYAQNQFYGPIYAYLTALLSFAIPLSAAFKLLFSLTLLITPVSFYYFVRSFGAGKTKSIATAIFMFSLLFVFPNNYLGGNLHSTLNIGLIAGGLGFALFFFYFGALVRARTMKQYILLSLLLTLIILTHVVATYVALIVLAVMLVASLNNKKSLKFLIIHGIIGFLLAAFWIIPFLAKREYFHPLSIGFVDVPFMPLLLCAIVYAGILIYLKKTEPIPIALFLLFLLVFSLISAYYFSLQFHFYRLTMFILLMFPPGVALTLRGKAAAVLAILFVLFGTYFIISVNGLETSSIATNKLPEIENITGRVFVIASYGKQPAVHYLQHALPMESGIPSLKGLYVESVLHSTLVLGLERELDPESYVWGISLANISLPNEEERDAILPKQFETLGITHVVSSEKFSDSWDAQKKVFDYFASEKINYSYYLYYVGNCSLFEVLSYKPRVIDKENWDSEVNSWFFSKEILKGILVGENVPDLTGNGNETIEILEKSPRQDYFKIKVNSEHEVPVLIKVSNYPNWKAYQGGKQLHIYQTSPYMMLVYGKGEIILKYEATWSDTFGLFLSIVGVLVLLSCLFFTKQ